MLSLLPCQVHIVLLFKKLGIKFRVNIKFSTVVFKKINLVPVFFKKYPNWSFPLNLTLRHQVLLMWQREVELGVL